MKKLLAMMLSFMLVMSLAACGDADTEVDDGNAGTGGIQNSGEKDPAGGQSGSGGEKDPAGGQSENDGPIDTTKGDLAEFLKNVQLMKIPSWLPDSGWEFVGARLDGEDLTQDEVKEVLNQQYGGMLVILYGSSGDVQMVQSEGAFQGTYQKLEDEYTVTLDLDYSGNALNYAAVFLEPKPGVRYMLLLLENSSDNIFYFRHIEEG